MSFFLLIYDRAAGKLVEPVREFSDEERESALQARFDRELTERERPDIEVVLLGAESLDAVRATHSRYFKSIDELKLRGMKSAG